MEKKQKKKTKFKEIRSAVTMMCVMVAMMSTATYAWFTLTDSPTVTGLQMTAVSSDGLKISKDHTNWYNAIDMSKKDDADGVEALGSFTLMPATISDKSLTGMTPNFYAPVYTGNAVKSVAKIEDADLSQYVASCTYYLQSSSGADVKVGIITANQSDVVGGKGVTTDTHNAVEAGSFVKVDANSNDGDATDNTAVEAIRIAFVVDKDGNASTTDDITMHVYEPNAGTGLEDGSTSATNEVGDPIEADIMSSYDKGEIMAKDATSGEWKAVAGDHTSDSFFTVVGGSEKYTTVKMYIWFEGKDLQCVDQIIDDVIHAQVQFTVIPDTTASDEGTT